MSSWSEMVILTAQNKLKAFVTFAREESLVEALNQSHQLFRIPLQLARVKEAQETCEVAARIDRVYKLFVGGIPKRAKSSEVRVYFEKFGEIQVLEIPSNSNKVNHGFTFVTFTDSESAQRVISRKHFMGGKPLEIKPSRPRRQESPNFKAFYGQSDQPVEIRPDLSEDQFVTPYHSNKK